MRLHKLILSLVTLFSLLFLSRLNICEWLSLGRLLCCGDDGAYLIRAHLELLAGP